MEYDNEIDNTSTDAREHQQYQQLHTARQFQPSAQQPQSAQQAHSHKKSSKQNNALPLWGNEASMNLNPLILANIQGSSYFKVSLFKLKTYHEVVDEIYYQVKHLEPWERGSRKTAGQTGMCGGVRGVGAGGIVSTAFCLLYKLYTLRLTRKQVNGLLTHGDSPYIRALGFMYLRYTQPPGDLFDWYQPYLLDEEEIDVKAGGGQIMTIGHMIRQWLTKLDWFSTLFPRIPVPIQKQMELKLEQFANENNVSFTDTQPDRGVGYASSGTQARGSAIFGSTSGKRGQTCFADGKKSPRCERSYSEQSFKEKSAKRGMFDHCDRDSSRHERVDDDFLQRSGHRDREYKGYRDRERDQDRNHVRERDRHENDCERERERDRYRYKERHRERGRDYERKDRNRSDRRSRSHDRDDKREYDRDRRKRAEK